MMRWLAGLAAVLLLPACGDGSGRPRDGRDPAGTPAGQVPSVRIISPESGASSTEGSTIPIEAVVIDPNGVVLRVDFYDDNRLIGSASSPPYIISYRRLRARTHLLCAVAVDFDGVPFASPPVTLFVVRGDGDDDDKGDDKDDRRGDDRKD